MTHSACTHRRAFAHIPDASGKSRVVQGGTTTADIQHYQRTQVNILKTHAVFQATYVFQSSNRNIVFFFQIMHGHLLKLI